MKGLILKKRNQKNKKEVVEMKKNILKTVLISLVLVVVTVLQSEVYASSKKNKPSYLMPTIVVKAAVDREVIFSDDLSSAMPDIARVAIIAESSSLPEIISKVDRKMLKNPGLYNKWLGVSSIRTDRFYADFNMTEIVNILKYDLNTGYVLEKKVLEYQDEELICKTIVKYEYDILGNIVKEKRYSYDNGGNLREKQEIIPTYHEKTVPTLRAGKLHLYNPLILGVSTICEGLPCKVCITGAVSSLKIDGTPSKSIGEFLCEVNVKELISKK